MDYPEERLRAESGAEPGISWIGTGSAAERLWTRPAITVTGLDAPKVDGASNTLVPAARARVAVRLAPGDTSANAFTRLREHLEQRVPWGARLTTTVVDAGSPPCCRPPGWLTPLRVRLSPRSGTARHRLRPTAARSHSSRNSAYFPRASILVTGAGDLDSRAHGPNEGLHLPEFERAVLAEALLFQRLGNGHSKTPP